MIGYMVRAIMKKIVAKKNLAILQTHLKSLGFFVSLTADKVRHWLDPTEPHLL